MEKPMWLVRVETKRKGLLSVMSKHLLYKTENGARNYISRILKRHSDCKCRLFKEVSTDYKQESFDFDRPEY